MCLFKNSLFNSVFENCIYMNTRSEKSRWLKGRHYFYELLHTPEVETRTEHYVRLSIAVIIALSMLSVILESEPKLEHDWAPYFYWFEVFVIVVFTIEYLLRLWSIVDHPKYSHWFWGRLRFIFTPLALVDLVAILPFYIPAFLPVDLRFVRTLRLVRFVRVMKLGHYSHSLGLITRVIKNKRHEMAAATFVVGILVVIASSIMYYIEHEAQPDAFRSIPKTLWWCIATLTTVGNGTYPITMGGKILSMLISILGIGVFALPSGIFVAGFIEEIQHKEKTIICSRCKAEIAIMESEAHLSVHPELQHEHH